MPLYEYSCHKCNVTTEVFHGVDAMPPKKCPQCGKLALRRVITVPATYNTYSPMHPRKNRGRGY
jgi:putative FmdB family regulatory protein